MRANKKGLSLVETVVALSILSLVFASTITLIINVLNLAMITRDKTEATASAQKGLADASAQIQGCNSTNIAPPGYVPVVSLPVGSSYERTINNKKVTITYNNAFASITSGLESIDNSNFIKVISSVDWKYRGVDQNVTVEQFVRKP